MPRRRSRERTPELDPEAVLSGAITPPVRALLRLIQDVNPTRRGRSPELERERYRLKARLQSLLIERHGEELVVRRTPRPGVVGLGHRTLREDAGHALTAGLSEAARRWVAEHLPARRAPGGAAPPAPPPPPDGAAR